MSCGAPGMPSLRPEFTSKKLHERMKGYLPDLLGVEVVSITPGKAKCRLTIRREFMAPHGFLHAASVTGLADTTCGVATLVHLTQGADSYATIELKLNLLGTVKRGSIACEAQLKHAGHTTQVWDSVVTDEETGRSIALFRCTQMILWPRSRSDLVHSSLTDALEASGALRKEPRKKRQV